MRPVGMTLGVLLSLTSCGADDRADGGQSDGPSTEEQIQQLFSKYNGAMDASRYDLVCSMNTSEFNRELVSEVQGAFGKRQHVTCERALQVVTSPVAGYEAPPMTNLVISGDTASAQVGPKSSIWRFKLEGQQWKVAYAN